MRADAYVFDIDGTLLVTRDLVHWNALRRAMLDVYGADTSIEGIPYHGMTDILILRAALMRHGIPEAEIRKKMPDALASICRDVATNCAGIVAEACSSVRALLDQLQDRRKLLTVASGNLETVGWHKIQAAGLRHYFVSGSFGDSLDSRAAIFDQATNQVRQQLGESATICFVGDTPSDVSAARAVRAKIIAVSSGGYSYEELRRHNPDLCCHSCGELIGKLD